ncbi:amidase [Dyadobacter sediminis]|uniref:Amidase n=1 Tax=Dyadobacter sediminis TaxID=1493691 RepID=A0A5R9KEV9_9BACT|nr:amidase [Dyadobacter sediminis]TLU94649.1 amidase [Dyadobacter sediminis]GGB89428.1 amidase [Dyadobacter sediminis]
MKRRAFIHIASAAGLSSVAFHFAGCSKNEKDSGNKEPESSQVSEMTIADMQKKMQDGALTSRSLTQHYLQQIEKYDRNGPKLNSVIELNPDALSIADAMDKERKSGKTRGALHGIPVLIKDNINTADKMQTTAGSLALEGNIAATDAFVVKQLRKAGAVILGKTNLSEWANFRSTRSSSGWSSRGGQTHNPYVLDRSPCGSSSGSGVAVAANLCAVAVGTETNGSIACPASMNGVVGIKPTVGLVSRSGIIPISKTQDTAGPMARTVADAAVLLGAMAGFDEQDAVENSYREKVPDYTAFLLPKGLNGKRIGVEKGFLKQHEGIDSLLKKALDQMKSQGATIVEVEFMKTGDVDGAESAVLQYEFKDGVNKYLSASNAKIKSLEELIAFNKANEEKVMPDFKQELFEVSQSRGNLESKEYKDALARIINVRDLLNKELEASKLDALCGPATGASWCIDPVNGDFWTGYGSYGPAALSGFPSITVPMGSIDELPVGISFLGKAYSEPSLISMAYAYEQVSKNRRAPRFIKTVQ